MLPKKGNACITHPRYHLMRYSSWKQSLIPACQALKSQESNNDQGKRVKVRPQARPACGNFFSSQWPKLSNHKCKCGWSCHKHMLVSEIKPCQSKYAQMVQWNCEWLIKSLVLLGKCGNFRANTCKQTHKTKSTDATEGLRAFIRWLSVMSRRSLTEIQDSLEVLYLYLEQTWKFKRVTQHPQWLQHL